MKYKIFEQFFLYVEPFIMILNLKKIKLLLLLLRLYICHLLIIYTNILQNVQ